MRFSDVLHQSRAMSILRRSLRSGRVHHAYLLEGPEGVGKELAARALAARLLCHDAALPPDADACGVCASCRVLSAGNHTDFHVVDRRLHKLHPDRAVRATKGLYLVVSIVRHFLIEPAGNRPSMGPRRVFLVRDAERMNAEAQNALLKTLEEPPGSVVIALVTSAASRLLPTIVSRCQRIPFDLLPDAFVREHLERRARIAPEAARTLAGLAQGRLGAALRWSRGGVLDALREVAGVLGGRAADSPEAFGKRIVELATALVQRPDEPGADEDAAEAAEGNGAEDEAPAAAGGSAREVATDELRDALKLVLMLAGAVLRDALVSGVGHEAARLLDARLAPVSDLTASQPERLARGIAAVAEAERMLDRNVSPQLACERLAVALGD